MGRGWARANEQIQEWAKKVPAKAEADDFSSWLDGEGNYKEPAANNAKRRDEDDAKCERFDQIIAAYYRTVGNLDRLAAPGLDIVDGAPERPQPTSHREKADQARKQRRAEGDAAEGEEDEAARLGTAPRRKAQVVEQNEMPAGAAHANRECRRDHPAPLGRNAREALALSSRNLLTREGRRHEPGAHGESLSFTQSYGKQALVLREALEKL